MATPPNETPSFMDGLVPAQAAPAVPSAAPAPSFMDGLVPVDSSDSSSVLSEANDAADAIARGASGVATGSVKGLGDTVSGVSHLINKIPVIGETLAPAQGISSLDKADVSKSTAEMAGKGLEGIAEFAIGDEALKGLSEATKLVALAKKYPAVAEVLNMAKDHPILAKLITGGTKGAAVGTVQGVVKGAQQGDAVKGAVEGAAGGGILGATAEAAPAAVAEVRAARAVKPTPGISTIDPEQFIYKDVTPAPQHGIPVKVESPLDRPTIDNLSGGKNLSPEAASQLQNYARVNAPEGEEIEVGSSSKNTLHKISEPLQKTLTDTGLKVNKVIQNAPPFSSSVLEDGKFDEAMDQVRDNFPAADEEKLNNTVDKEIQSADEALRSKDPSEILSYRRKLGTQIDWDNIAKNPQSPGEAQNVARAKLYAAFGDKLHTIPEMVNLDKTYQTSLELQRFLDKNGVDRNPVLANAEHQSELSKGKTQIFNDAHNEVVAKNRVLAGLPESDVNPSIAGAPCNSPVDKAVDLAVSKFGIPEEEEPALKRLLQPNVKSGKVFGTNTDWYDALKSFDDLTPEEKSARFSDPNSVRDVLKKQTRIQAGKWLVKYGSIAAAAHELGVDRFLLKSMLGE